MKIQLEINIILCTVFVVAIVEKSANEEKNEK